ncbi:RnfABCDGE type electron transport complex subunit D [Cohnella nanjingensis]|uniref:RnfABCDGE type electron transport complex subunit D n=1 Tax=Cohnella nanjingensis TaxID=1387779 RepID=A0A7X0RVP2_9BACL|nr:RnfABCDGE type electron transport complex subunit D [Cohnella nanjingensis]MBB6674451.1 RnfABCDGE type electron transport complex subunit D [Cohnella nanjingensis]
MTLRQWFKSPKGYVAIAMAAYLLIASAWSQDIKGMINGLIAVGAALVVDVICCLIEKRKRILPDGAVITGLIIALVLGTTTSWPIVAGTAAISILSKHLLVHRKKPVFNPAAFGLMLSIPIFHAGQSWWGAFGDLPAWGVALILIGGYIVTDRVHKFPQIFSFFGFFFLALFLMGHYSVGDAADALRPPFINAALFFGFFMLTDLPTSPAKVIDQIVFGILAAAAGAAVYGAFGGLMYLFIGLLLANLYHLLKIRLTINASKTIRPTVRKPMSEAGSAGK